jgi:hypothetical protein
MEGEFIRALRLERPLPNKRYSTPDYQAEVLDRIPDYRVQLHWAPNIHLTGNEHSEYFYTSDVKGTYQILFEGYTIDGQYLVAKQYFETR